MNESFDTKNVISFRLLRRAIAEGNKPVVFWIGAGASAWNGYPSWKELALQMRRGFYLYSENFDNDTGLRLIGRDLPAFFQLCRDNNRALYHKFLTDALSPRPITPIYQRFIRKLSAQAPVHVLTTNCDESLEQCAGPIKVIQKTDLELCATLLAEQGPFVGKLHGTVSSVESMVFCTKDYDLLTADRKYLAALFAIFYHATVIFLGYSVRDEYVLTLLQRTVEHQDLFGTGRHFLVTADQTREIAGLHRISYRTDRFKDHRTAMRVLDVIQQSQDNFASQSAQIFESDFNAPSTSNPEKTAYYISDFKPPGTWSTEETAQFKGRQGESGVMTIGLGFSDDEIKISSTAAMHDFAVGLICFDHVYLQLISLNALFGVLKEDLFKEVIVSDALRFVHPVHVPAVMYQNDSSFGALIIVLLGGSGKLQTFTLPGQSIPEISVREMLERQISAIKGKEEEAARVIDRLEAITQVFRYDVNDPVALQLCDALLMPNVTKLLGISDSILPTQVPLWLKFPYLRLADLVQTGAICAKFGIQAAKVHFGGTQLVSAAFGVQLASEWAERVASYTLSKDFDTDLGLFVMHNPQFVRQILIFRNSPEGERFRREISNALLRETGAEFTASVNAGLARNLPSTVLQRSHNKLLALMTEDASLTLVPAVWGQRTSSDESTIYWRRKTFRMLMQMCKDRGIKKDSSCICGSGDKLRLCCMHPLTS